MFREDPEYAQHEAQYRAIARELLGEESEEDEGDGDGEGGEPGGCGGCGVYAWSSGGLIDSSVCCVWCFGLLGAVYVGSAAGSRHAWVTKGRCYVVVLVTLRVGVSPMS